MTVDISASGIRLLQIQGDRVERWGFTPLVRGTAPEDSVGDPQTLGARISSLMRATGMRGTRVIVSISGLYSVSRLLDLDFQPGAATEERLRRRIEESIPAQGLRFHWQLMASDEATYKVLVVGAPETIVQEHVEILKAASLVPKAMETRAMALVRAVGKRSAVVANVDSASIDVVLVVDGIPEFMRALEMPLALGTEERAEFVSRAIRQTIDFYQARGAGATLPADTELIVVGSLARDPKFRETLMTQVDIPEGSFAPAVRVPSHFALEEYAVNLGLALRVLNGNSSGQSDQAVRLTIDLLPRRRRVTFPVWARVLAVVAVVGLVLTFVLYSRAEAARQETYNLQQRLTIIERQVSSRQVELRLIASMEAALSDFSALVNSQGDLTGILGKVTAMVPENAKVNSLSATASNVGVSGKADRAASVIEYINALRASGLFGKVDYTQTQTGEIAFSLGATRLAQPTK